MNYEIVATKTFRKKVKELSKKYHSLKNDLEEFEKELLKNPEMGDNLGGNVRKVRMAITSKNKGKSGGARVITFHFFVDFAHTDIYLLTIYDKGEQRTISSHEIENLKKESDLFS